ncbi:hypothetical protein ACFXA3_02460 [Streptomyces sp. NPDC059456]|uniref:hypothetical protein n=1 Tax=Streptomyces sp. NPDC059456 TaxID=3346838 RepID=UPI0036CD4E9B
MPDAISKGLSGRAVYLPVSVLRDLHEYPEWDRREAIEYGRARGFYIPTRRSLVVEDPTRPRVRLGGRWVPISRLDSAERRRLLVGGDQGFEPAMVWLNQWGLPMSVSGWEQVFADANAPCAAAGVGVRTSPHGLRHSSAVITLELLVWDPEAGRLSFKTLQRRAAARARSGPRSRSASLLHGSGRPPARRIRVELAGLVGVGCCV